MSYFMNALYGFDERKDFNDDIANNQRTKEFQLTK